MIVRRLIGSCRLFGSFARSVASVSFRNSFQTRKFLPLRSSSVLERRMHPQSPLPWPENGFRLSRRISQSPSSSARQNKKFSALPTGFRESHACYLYTRGNRCSRLFPVEPWRRPRRCERRLFMVARTVVLRRRLGRISPGPTLFQPVFPFLIFIPRKSTFSTCSPVTLNGSGRKSPAPRGNCSQPRRAPTPILGRMLALYLPPRVMWAVSIKLSARVPRLNKNHLSRRR